MRGLTKATCRGYGNPEEIVKEKGMEQEKDKQKGQEIEWGMEME